MPNLLANYRADGPNHDELRVSQGAAKQAWEHLSTAAGLLTWDGVLARRNDVDSILADQGILRKARHPAPWRLDPLPMMVDPVEWRWLEKGLAQRALVFDAILRDVYGPRKLLLDGILPAEVVLGHPGFIRAADGTTLNTTHQLFLTSTQLGRTTQGWVAVSDVTDMPTALGHVMADRRAVSDVLSHEYSTLSVHRLGPFYQTLRERLAELSPTPHDSPRVVMLVPASPTPAFDHTYLADTLAIPVVTPDDLIVADGRLWLRTLGDAEPVDVVLRQLPSQAADPVDLTATGVGGVPGLIETAHSGSVAVVNPIGAGVLENPALLTFLPDVCQHVLGEELILNSVETYWCGERSMGSHVIANLEDLVVMSTVSGERINGWELSTGERADLATQISAMPHTWVGQHPATITTSPIVEDNRLHPHPTTIYTFGLAQSQGFNIMPGGLGCTTDTYGVVTQDVLAKDVWVLTGGAPTPNIDPAIPRSRGPVLAAGSASNLFEFGTNLERAEGLLRLARNHSTSPTADMDQPVSMEEVSEALATLVKSAHLVRDHLTPEAWRALGVLENPAPIAQYLVNIIALAGVLHESITHDRSWALIMLGKRLQRCDFLLTTAIDAVDNAQWQDPLPANSPRVGNFLRLHDSVLSFRRHNQFRAAIPSLIELLLLSRSNPRSLAFNVHEMTMLIATLPKHAAHGGRPEELLKDIEETLSGIDLGEQVLTQGSLSALLHRLVGLIRDLFQAIRTQQFGQLGTALWTAEAQLQQGAS